MTRINIASKRQLITPLTSYEIVILGAGNVATHLARRLYESGHRISCIFSRNDDSVEILAAETESMASSDPDKVPDAADFYILCVPDAVVPELIIQFQGKRGIWIHTAGAVSMDVFKDQHAEYGVLYPLQTLSKQRELAGDHIPFLVEGSDLDVLGKIKNLAGSISGIAMEVDSKKRLLIHLAAVFANNFSNHMIHIAERIMEEASVETEILAPILRETVEKAISMGAGRSQTGPARRGDEDTKRKHLELLKSNPEWEKLYTFISRDIGRISE